MLYRNYIKIGWRSLWKDPSTSLIKILGLSFAIGWAITCYLFIEMMRGMDQYHTKKDQIVQVTNFVASERGVRNWGDSPLPLGPTLADTWPQVENFFRLEYQSGSLKFGEKVFRERLTFADPGVFQMLDYEFEYGSAELFDQKGHLVISHDIMEKYFANLDPIGQVVSIKFDIDESIHYFTVIGVLEEYPYPTSMGQDFYVPMSHLFDLSHSKQLNWSYFTDATFLQLKSIADTSSLIDHLQNYISIQNEQEKDWKIKQFAIVPISKLPWIGHTIEGSISNGGQPSGWIAMGTSALLLVLMACFNYMNLALASATRRNREIGLRKVMGGVKSQIMIQFLTENYLVVLFSILFGIALCYAVFLPILNIALPVTFPFSLISVPHFITFLLILSVVIGFLSGAYPALFVSRFSPIVILRDKLKLGHSNFFGKILTALQLALAMITVVACFVFTDQSIYMNQKEWGYKSNGILAISVKNQYQLQEILKLGNAYSHVYNSTTSESHIGYPPFRTLIRQRENDIRTMIFKTSTKYPELMGLELLEGTFFDTVLHEEQNRQILVNEVFVKEMGWIKAIGQIVQYDSLDYQVVGVVKNFEYDPYFGYNEKLPVAFFVSYKSKHRWVVLETNADSVMNLKSEMEKHWSEIAPHDPYEAIVQAHVFDDFYVSNRSNILIMSVISFLAIFIACLGLYGVLAFSLERRKKELSIRKILGSNNLHLTYSAAGDLTLILFFSILIGSPVGYYLMHLFMQQLFPDIKPMTLFPFLTAIISMLVVAGVTLLGQLRRIIQMNPSDNLRSD